jgi:catechol 2,3-dioxygenase-like lactoylglutathione lyase family enzyme
MIEIRYILNIWHSYGDARGAGAAMRYHSVAIFVKDIEISKRYYEEVLGRTIEYDFGKNVILKDGISIWEIDPGHVIAEKLETKNGSNRFELYFETDDIQAAQRKLHQQGVRLLHDVREEPWGQRTARFFDPDGHLIEIGETLPTFLRRMHDQGMTEDEISKKSHVPLERVREFIRA